MLKVVEKIEKIILVNSDIDISLIIYYIMIIEKLFIWNQSKKI